MRRERKARTVIVIYREILSYSSGKEEVVGRVELDDPEDVCRIVTEFPELEQSLQKIVGHGGIEEGPVTPEDGEVYLNALEIEFAYGFTRVGPIRERH